MMGPMRIECAGALYHIRSRNNAPRKLQYQIHPGSSSFVDNLQYKFVPEPPLKNSPNPQKQSVVNSPDDYQKTNPERTKQ
jgi:hypothetical protein